MNLKTTPEQIEKFYTVRYLCPIKKKWIRTRWKMSKEEAASRYKPGEFEMLEGTVEERKLGGDPLSLSMARLYVGHKPE